MFQFSKQAKLPTESFQKRTGISRPSATLRTIYTFKLVSDSLNIFAIKEQQKSSKFFYTSRKKKDASERITFNTSETHPSDLRAIFTTS